MSNGSEMKNAGPMMSYKAPPLNLIEEVLKKAGLMVMPKMKPLLDKAAGGLANDLAKITPPLVGGKAGTGATAEAYYAGAKSLRGDINRLFKPLNSVPFASLVKGKDYQAAEAYKFKFDNPRLAKAYAQGNWQTIYNAFANSPNSARFGASKKTTVVAAPNNSLHDKYRDKKGRVKKGVMPILVAKGRDSINQYIEKQKKLVGTMVSGWYWCAVRLKARVPTNWTGKSPKGSVTYKVSKDEAGITIANPMGNYNGFLSANANLVKLAQDHWMKKLQKESEVLLQKELEKATRKAQGLKPTSD